MSYLVINLINKVMKILNNKNALIVVISTIILLSLLVINDIRVLFNTPYFIIVGLLVYNFTKINDVSDIYIFKENDLLDRLQLNRLFYIIVYITLLAASVFRIFESIASTFTTIDFGFDCFNVLLIAIAILLIEDKYKIR